MKIHRHPKMHNLKQNTEIFNTPNNMLMPFY